ncbi:MAG: ATP-binding protein [Saprospiraceae bacterium]
MEIKRALSAELRAHLSEKEITLLIGPRQAGKTTLLKALVQDLEKEGRKALFFNLDIDTDAQYFSSQHRLLERIEAEVGKEPAYIFIDEVQRIENAGLYFKGLYDRMLPYKWIATGSGSLELKEKIAESLVGRKRNFYLSTVSIQEFIVYKTAEKYAKNLPLLLSNDPILEDRLLREYLTFGGYPRVVTASTHKEKQLILAEIFQGYIERDIQLLLQLEKSRAFTTLLQLIANRTGQLTNYNDLSRHTNLSLPTLKNYLWYSEKTFITQAITPFFRNKEKEIVKSPQYYFYDAGLRNFLLNRTSLSEHVQDFALLFQQLILQLLTNKYKHTVASIHYWRTQNQAEVDFVVNTGTDLLAVEVKSAQLKEPKISRSLHSFINHYHPSEAWVVNRQLNTHIQLNKTKVYFLPWYQLLNEQQ